MTLIERFKRLSKSFKQADVAPQARTSTANRRAAGGPNGNYYREVNNNSNGSAAYRPTAFQTREMPQRPRANSHRAAVETNGDQQSPPAELSNGEAIPSPRLRQGRPNRASRVQEEDFEYLRKFDTVFLIDDSYSMTTGKRRFDAWNLLKALLPIAAKFDDDGVDVHLMNDEDRILQNITHLSSAADLWDGVRFQGDTPMGMALDRILRPYISTIAANNDAGIRTKRLNVIFITDGRSTDDVEEVIVHYAERLDQLNAPMTQLGIQFAQVGDDEDAGLFLDELDDELQRHYKIRDIVDTTPYEEGSELTEAKKRKILLGAINKRIDKMSNRDLEELSYATTD